MPRVRRAPLLIAILLLSPVAWAQDAGTATDPGDGPEIVPVVINPPRPRTRLEAFVARKETVLIKAYTEIGTVQGEEGSALKITAVEITDAAKQEKAYGLVLAVRSRAGREATSWVDYDELQTLAAGLDALRSLDPNIVKLQNYEASFRSKGDVDVTNYDNNGARFVAVRTTQVAPLTGQLNFATAHFRLATTAEMHQHITTAKDLLDKLRTVGEQKKD